MNFKTPSSMQKIKSEATYRDIVDNLDKHPLLIEVKKTSCSFPVIFFIYKAGEKNVLLMTPGADVKIVEFNGLPEANIGYIYIFCYA